ncbi:GspE/PulE family protein [Psychroserpens algicola]|uniref:GspE/PulE family protein n=1 Tax=Psychroserpens algicola TaxID=1719034 RepID=A0ABT0H3R4_9FLAO|nr:GspE/PulE family protein [Psychroserpens algicola]MCK8479021.1 GspE/PulE family protein [Psychroserpens algicola]
MIVEDYKIPVHLTQLISSEQAYQYNIIPYTEDDNLLVFKSVDTSEVLKQELQIILGRSIQLIHESPENIKQYLSSNYRLKNQSQTKAFNYSSDFLEQLLTTAKDIGSSDIHFEAYENRCRVRFRLDGKLKEYFIIKKEDYPIIVNKLKIKAGLDISEKRLPQDGRITIKTSIDEFDIRVSSLPTLHSEKLVLRILSKDAEHISLGELGFSDKELNTYRETIKKPNGIILISGPTGSGKTTTLYATLKLLNDEQRNILTIEDPIEYTLEGVNQVQLKENIGLDFTSTLRTFLRQDPDVIMVGEIRDAKTANMAIRAALTGHLVLSTIHTNSAWATITRLVDMDIAPFLIASTLNVSVAQRLVRKLCHHCKQETSVDESDFPSSFKAPKELNKKSIAIGCDHCYYTGYLGRKAIYEIIPITKELIVHIKNNNLEIDQYIKQQGIVMLKDNAIELVKSGITSIDEVYSLLI